MPSIAIIDDRKDMRDTIKANVVSVIEEGWDVLDVPPLPALTEYPGWITEKNVAVILLDERLNEQAESPYQGHDLVTYIRNRFPTLPIFVITSYSGDPELAERFRDVEEILPREEFAKRAEDYVPRFTRAGQRFVEVFQNELAELADKAQLIAKGEATEEDVERTKAIQSRINISYSDALGERNRFVNELGSALSEFEALSTEIEEFLRSQ